MTRRGDPRVPQHTQAHERRAHRHEQARAVPGRERAEARREQGQKQGSGDAHNAGRRGVVPQRALHEQPQVEERDVQRSVDHERGDVRDREVAGPEQGGRDQGVGTDLHQGDDGHGGDGADRQRDEGRDVVPFLLLPPDGGQRHRGRAQPVEARRHLLVARLGDVANGGVHRHHHQRDVDQERRAPRDRLHQQAADERPEDGGPRGRSGPDAEGPPPLFPGERGVDDGERPRNQQGPHRPLEQAEQDERLEVPGQAARERGDAEPDQPQGEHAPPAEVVREGTGQDQQGGQREEVPAIDVVLGFQRAEQARMQVLADARKRDADHGGVEEHDPGPQDHRDHGPALAARLRGLCQGSSLLDPTGPRTSEAASPGTPGPLP